MIVKFKLFEEYNTIEIGDYVIVDGEKAGYADDGIHFFNTHVGTIRNVSSTNKICSVKFDEDFKDETLLFCSVNSIAYHTKNKKDAELYLASIKYNL